MNKNKDNNQNDKGKNPFSLPADYFSSFSQRMMHKIELAEELKEFKILSSLDKTLPFVTPENYFEQSASGAEVKMELAGYSALSGIRKQNMFVVPPMYFAGVSKSILNKIEAAAELESYPSLKAIEKKNNFEVPAAYFETVSQSVLEKVKTEERGYGRVIQLVFSRKTAYALAAMLVLSLGLWYYNSQPVVSTGCNTLACLDKSEILNDIQVNSADEESLMEMVDPEKLSKNLKIQEEGDKKEKEDYVLENTDINDL